MRSRYQFYLAQSYRDCGEKEKALQAYLKRAELGFWIEEVFMSLYSAAKLQEALGRPFDEVMATYRRASEAVPGRAEALHGASRYCRLAGRYQEGYEAAKRTGLFRGVPDGLFVEPWIYEYGLLDEFAINAYWIGAYRECLDACERILREGKCPQEHRARIQANATFARQKLAIGNTVASATEAASGRDVRLLMNLLADERDPAMIARHTFQLANALRDSGEREAALDAYLKRARLGHRNEEIFVSLLGAARLKEALEYSSDDVISAYMEAAAFCPTRAEALHGAARFCRNKGLYERGYQAAKQGLAISYPNEGLFIEDWVYEYGLLDELAVNAYWVGAYQECLDACERILCEGKCPQDQHSRIEANAAFAREKLGISGAVVSAAKPASATRTLAVQVGQATAEPIAKAASSAWTPQALAAGTELMVAGLRRRMGQELDLIDLQVNHPGYRKSDGRPKVVWMHHNVDQQWVQWCKDRELVDTVDCFIFVSYWQREQYLNAFGLPPERCVVLRHALELSRETRRWEAEPIWRCAYTSTPFRGLSVLLDAWARLSPANAELHIWSSMRLYLMDDRPYEHLFERARSMRGVVYHGIAPNSELRAALRGMQFLVYPCTFAETACLSVIEAMAAGCRVIVPSLGALPETTAGYARIYPWAPEAHEHVAAFAETLAAELAAPWGGKPELSLAQQSHCSAVYNWEQRLCEWRELIRWTRDRKATEG